VVPVRGLGQEKRVGKTTEGQCVRLAPCEQNETFGKKKKSLTDQPGMENVMLASIGASVSSQLLTEARFASLERGLQLKERDRVRVFGPST